jgi:hypothetical protein
VGRATHLLRGSRGFRPVRGCRNHMHDLVAAAFELVENFGQREDGAGVNVVQRIASLSLSSASVTPRASSLGAPPLRQAAPLQQGRRALHWRRFTSLRHLRGAISRRGHDQLSALKPFVGSVRPLWRRKDIHARHHLHDLPPSRPRRSDCVPDRGYLMTPCSGIERVRSVWLNSWAGATSLGISFDKLP